MSARSVRFIGTGVFLLVGSAHIASAQRQIQKLLPSHPESHASYAFECAMSGDWAITSASGSSQIYGGAGAAYVSQRINGTWIESQTLLDATALSSASFGSAVAMEGDWAVIGAPRARPTGGSGNGAGMAYVYERVGTSWIERQRLTHPTPAWGNDFGERLDISGNHLAVYDRNYTTGQVFVFERVGSIWNHVASLQPSDVPYGGYFGVQLDIDGDTLVAAGSSAFAYVFERTAQGVWTLQQQIPAPNHEPGGLNNGVAVALSGDTLFLSSWSETVDGAPKAGRAHIFRRIGGAWTEFQTLTPNDVVSDDQFYVKLAKGDVAIGHSPNDDDWANNAGALYLFGRSSTGLWLQTGKVVPTGTFYTHGFGWNPALDGEFLMAGASGDNEACAGLPPTPGCHTGAVYFFQFPSGVTQYGMCNTATPCSNPYPSGGCRNSTGQGAVILSSGSVSTANDDLIFEVRKLPPNAPALFFMGDAEAFTILGAGQLRVGGGALGLYRLGIGFANAQGVIVRSPGLVASTQALGLGAITAGQTWNFQAWYRDTPSTCAPSNLSSALRVAFTP